ncbi:MAG: hypothetical protein II131_05170 [Neisseriaceae bacterium]|nr:hypothetical protein [Neisseriaceae bacterium]
MQRWFALPYYLYCLRRTALPAFAVNRLYNTNKKPNFINRNSVFDDSSQLRGTTMVNERDMASINKMLPYA